MKFEVMKFLNLLAVAVMFAMPARAATRDEIYDAMQRCNVMNDNRVWLDCIYGAVQPMRAELSLPEAPEHQVRLVPSAAAPKPARAPASVAGGITHLPPKKEGFIAYVLGGRKEVEGVPFQSYNFDRAGHFTLTLANGQVWRQVDNDSHTASWKADPGRYIASIKTGALGSSILQVRGESGAFMVTQVP
ncbi:MAG TPA: hypothetical protein VFI23_12120 [Rhizomicrobium sp.]|nr:hypothetical protein [Rhizomicrobium sp.]